ncbi:hypothetical protein F5Y08DRAFT_217183 [Xylaria arbuscula]|nr:hypothetical protein F5Y08DRAFT_217183 [Xylaria arbuscula]
MTRSAANITKACEVCRKAKLRCDGNTPCRRCVDKERQADCQYRQRPRVRKPNRRPQSSVGSEEQTSPASHSNQQVDIAGGVAGLNVEGQPEPYHQSVAATHEYASDCIFTSRLFYGPSSAFAFSQQVYRILWQLGEADNEHAHIGSSDTVQEGGPGLSLLKQRAIFFGTPNRVDSRSVPQSITQTTLSKWLPFDEAEKLLAHFISTNLFQLPFFSPPELADLLRSVYNSEVNEPASPQVKAIILATLANGALNTCNTNLAESLFHCAKQEAASCDDEVSLTMTHISLLLAMYQNNIGRPHSSYLHTGVASRKLFAMGLHSYGPEGNARPDMIQKRRIMAWSVYYHETIHALFLGRESTYKKASIRTPFPDHQPTLVGLCKLAQIAEDSAATIYGSTCGSLWQLYQAAEKLHTRLQACAEELGIASSTSATRSSLFTPTAMLLLHNIYYHILLLIFRPFLIAEFALHLKQPSNPRNRNQMWLIRARRIAIEAAQDCIVYMNEVYHDFNSCRTIRFNAFFLESSSQALCYDMLRNPSKLSYNKEYIKTALDCLDQMLKDEPIVHTVSSMTETLRIVEQHLTMNTTERRVSEQDVNKEQADLTREPTQQQQANIIPSVTHDFLVDESEHMIYLNGINFPDPLIQYNNPNSFTTDLFNFFPLDTISDDSTSPWQM